MTKETMTKRFTHRVSGRVAMRVVGAKGKPLALVRKGRWIFGSCVSGGGTGDGGW
jgi:hypothetical protein